MECKGSDSQKSGFKKKKKRGYVGQKGKFLERRVIPRKNVEKIIESSSRTPKKEEENSWKTGFLESFSPRKFHRCDMLLFFVR